LYHYNMKHTKFELNWIEGVAWRNSQRFSTNIKAGHKFGQRHLEAEFGQSKFSKPHHWGGGDRCRIFSTQPQKKLPNFEFVSKSYDRFTEPHPS
jgi:hypothetical protein